MKKVAVILSGCGFLDGSEVYETVLLLWALEQCGASYQCFAPDILQTRVMNFITQELMPERRNVLIESARLVRGQIQDVKQANMGTFDALIFPGGYGAATNLSNFATQEVGCVVNADVKNFTQAMAKAGKPLGFICIAPTLIPTILGPGIHCTIGQDQQTAATLTKMGAIHEDCNVENIVIDKQHKVVSTPAYMLGQSINEVAQGINKLVKAVLAMTN